MGKLYIFELTNIINRSCNIRVEMDNDVKYYYGNNENMFADIGNMQITCMDYDKNEQEIVLFVK